MKRISKILFLTFVILVMGGYETYACVVQGKEPFWNHFHKKKLDLQIDFSSSYNNKPAGHWRLKDLTCDKFFDFDDIKPGDFGEGTISLHLKNQDAWGCAIVRPTKNDDKSLTEPEQLEETEDNSQQDKWDGELAQNLNFKIWADICKVSPARLGDNIFQPDCDQLLSTGTGPLDPIKLALADSANPNVFTGAMGPMKRDKTYYIGAEWNVPAGVGNKIQTDTYKADIAFFAEQSDENKNFRCADIRDGNPEKCVNGITRECYGGPENTKDFGICKSGNETCSRGDWGKCTGEVLPEKEICGDNKDNDCDEDIDENCPPPCGHKNDCNDYNKNTDDSCVKGKCVNKPKNNYWR